MDSLLFQNVIEEEESEEEDDGLEGVANPTPAMKVILSFLRKSVSTNNFFHKLTKTFSIS